MALISASMLVWKYSMGSVDHERPVLDCRRISERGVAVDGNQQVSDILPAQASLENFITYPDLGVPVSKPIAVSPGLWILTQAPNRKTRSVVRRLLRALTKQTIAKLL